jgi:glycosyltransferase involved in cell wall biosynthesis
VASLRDIIRESDATVVHAHGVRSLATALAAGARRLVCTFHDIGNLPGERLRTGFKSSTMRVLPRFATCFAVQPVRWRGWTFAPHMSPTARLLAPMATTHEETVHALWVGRLDDRKLPILFVRAVAHAAHRGTPVQATLIGDGPAAARVDEEIAISAAPFHRLSRVGDLQEHLQRSSVVCMFSRAEGLTFAIQEGMAVGRPVICSPLPSLRWLCGDTAMYADSEEAIAAALARLVSTPTRQLQGELMRARFEEFRAIADATYDRYVSAYE